MMMMIWIENTPTSNSPNACNLWRICSIGAEETCKQKQSNGIIHIHNNKNSYIFWAKHEKEEEKTGSSVKIKIKKRDWTSKPHFTFFSITHTPIFIFVGGATAPSSAISAATREMRNGKLKNRESEESGKRKWQKT